MWNNLAEDFNKRIEEDIVKKEKVRPKTVKRAYGFVVEEADNMQPSPEEAKKQKLLSETKKVAIEMQRKNIPIITVLPAVFWDELCRKYLYRFENLNKDGFTGINLNKRLRNYCFAVVAAMFAFMPLLIFSCFKPGSVTLNMYASMVMPFVCLGFIFRNNNLEKGLNFCLLMLMAGFASLYLSWAFLGEYLPLNGSLLTPKDVVHVSLLMAGAVAFGAVMFIYIFVFGAVFFSYGKEVDSFLIKFFCRSFCFKDKKDMPIEKDGSNKVKINFLIKTPEFKEIFEKLENCNYRPLIAAAPKAFEIDQKGFSEALEEERRALDPIIFTKHGEVVVVHYQIGKFATEEDVIDWAREKGYKIALRRIK